MARRRPDRRGVALLEALIALAILSSAGIATVSLIGASLRAEQSAVVRERTISAAERLLSASTLLTRRDLDRRIGSRHTGAFVVTISRPEPALYRIGVADTLSLDTELLVTVVYRPEVSP